MRKIAMLILTISLSSIIGCYSQSSPLTIVENFFSHLESGNNTGAVKSLPVSSNIENDTSFYTRISSTLHENEISCGKFCGYELIEQNEISESYIISEYLIKYLNAPRRVQFIFYKPVDKWQVNQININFRERSSRVKNRTTKQLN